MPPRLRGLPRVLMAAIPVIIFALAAVVLARLARETRLDTVLDSLRATGVPTVLAALAATAASYLVITSYDALILRSIGVRLSYPRAASTVFVAATISASLGFTMLTSGPIRLRLYTAQGVAPRDVGKVVLLGLLMYWSGFLAVGGLAFTIAPGRLPASFPLSPPFTRALGLLFLGVVAAYAAACGARAAVRIRGTTVSAPPLGAMAVQVLVASLDWILAATVLVVIIRPLTGTGFVTVLEAYLLASSLGMLSHVPGGLGVFEAVLVLVLGPSMLTADVVAGLVLYRLVYFVVPFLGGVLTFATKELARLARRRP